MAFANPDGGGLLEFSANEKDLTLWVGFIDKTLKLSFGLAMIQHDLHLPKLLVEKCEAEPPLPYPASCRPQTRGATVIYAAV